MQSIGLFLAESPWGAIDEEAMGKGLGGRETALVHLAVEWAKLGYDVYAFVPRDDSGIRRVDNLRFIPNGYVVEMTVALDIDLFISWENTEVLAELRDAGYQGTTAIEMQVAHLESEVPVSDVADYVCVLSDWAGRFFLTQHPDCNDRMLVFPNGVTTDRFKRARAHVGELDSSPEVSDFHFIYSSSPDRGLHHLLRIWPDIQTAIMRHFETGAHLHICYGIESFVGNSMWSHREDGQRAVEIMNLINQDGVVYHGKIGQNDLAQLMVECDLMLYPCDTMSPTETGCISIVEALSAGCPVVTTDCDCIGEDYDEITRQTHLPFDGLTYIDAIIDALDPEDYAALREAGIKFAESERDWSVIARQWAEYFNGVVDLNRAEAMA